MVTTTPTGDGNVLEVVSPVLGKIRMPEEEGFTFGDGLLGFPDARHFVLLPAGRNDAFWLQSTEFPPLTFLLVDPFEWVEGFSIDLDESELGPLCPEEPGDLVILAILTLGGPERDETTINLQGPLALNVVRKLGRQIVLPDSPWGIRWPVEPDGARLAS